MQTVLNLLTRDGVVYVAFRPALSAEQYAALLELSHQGVTRQELLDAISDWAGKEALELSFEE